MNIRECLLSKVPVLIEDRRHFHRISSREDCCLKYPTCIDEDLPSQSIYVHCITEMGMQKLVYRVKHAQLSVRCNDKWFYHCMGVQPAFKIEQHKLWPAAKLNHRFHALQE